VHSRCTTINSYYASASSMPATTVDAVHLRTPFSSAFAAIFARLNFSAASGLASLRTSYSVVTASSLTLTFNLPVRMELQRQLSECFFDVCFASPRLNAQDLVRTFPTHCGIGTLLHARALFHNLGRKDLSFWCCKLVQLCLCARRTETASLNACKLKDDVV
jgi:hypothetical protein